MKIKLSPGSHLKYEGKDHMPGSVVEVPDDVGNALLNGQGATLVESTRTHHRERDKKEE